MQNRSYGNDFDLHENETACKTRFHMKGFALRLILKQRHKRTRKWPSNFFSFNKCNLFCFVRVLEYQKKTQVGDFIY